MEDPKPSSYPRHDAAEVNSVNLVANLLDAAVVKTEFGRRDKFPNIDGFVELIERDGDKETPVGKLDVQIKTLPKGKMQFDCPMELIAYGETNTLPVLLICADYPGRKAYWRHVHRGMPEYKANQDSFVVRFDPAVDVIDERTLYLARWREIVAENQRRHREGPLLREAMKGELGMAGLQRPEVTKIQRFSDRLNAMLDGELRFVKDLYFPEVWKLGVAVTEIDERWFSYHLFSIPFGASSPLIVNLVGRPEEDVVEAVRAGKEDPLGLNVYGEQRFESSRSLMSQAGVDVVGAATSTVLDYVRKAVDGRELPVSGRAVAVEVLFQFVDRHGHAMGLAEGDRYAVSAVNYGLHVHLSAWLRLALKTWLRENQALVLQSHCWPDLSNLTGMGPVSLRPTEAEVKAVIDTGGNAGPLTIRMDRSELKMVVEALELLLSEGVTEIVRPYARRADERVFIWDGYPPGEAERRLRHVVEQALPEYRALLTRLGFRPKLSNYGNGQSGCFRLRKDPGHRGEPVVESVAYRGSQQGESWRVTDWTEKEREVEIDGMTYPMARKGSSSGSALFSRTPVLDAVYAMLQRDLRSSYPTLRFRKEVSGIV